MRKIIASEMITVDGYFAGEDGALDWFFKRNLLKTALNLAYNGRSIERRPSAHHTGRKRERRCLPLKRSG
jgi:hypothetical protein